MNSRLAILGVTLSFLTGCTSPSLERSVNAIEDEALSMAVHHVRLVPGGELVFHSSNMVSLISSVTNNPDVVKQHLSTETMTYELAYALGLVQEKWAIDTLIESIPTSGVVYTKADPKTISWAPNLLTLTRSPNLTNSSVLRVFETPETMLYYCTIHSLTHLTGENYGRERDGTFFSPETKGLWEAWWRDNREQFNFECVERNTACGKYNLAESRVIQRSDLAALIPQDLSESDRQSLAHRFFILAQDKFDDEEYEAADSLIFSGLKQSPDYPDLLILRGKLQLRRRLLESPPSDPVPRPSVVVGEPLEFRFYDPGEHMNGIEELRIQMTTDPGGDLETMVLKKAAVRPGAYSGEIKTTKGRVKPLDGVLQVDVGGQIRGELSEIDQQELDIKGTPVIIEVKDGETD